MISFKKHVRRFLNILRLKCVSRISDFEDLPPDNSSYDDSWMDNATPGLNPDGTPDFHIVMTLHRNPMGSHFTETYGHILPPKTLLSLFPPMPEGLSPPPYHKRAKMRGALVHRPDSCLETDSSMDDKEQHGYDGGEQSIRDEDLEESSECSYQLSSLAYDSGVFF